MPRSEYYHRQADLCVRMALSAGVYEERIRLLYRANNIGIWPREMTLPLVTTSLNDLRRVVTDDCVLEQVGI
jgi:hypothetical protein